MTSSGPIATIDIGTNSVLLTIVALEAGDLKVLTEAAHITRIGEGLGLHQEFQAHAMARTADLLEQYLATCREHNVDKLITVGTAAFRRAANAKDFVRDMKRELGLEIEIISGTREAELSYLAARRDFGDDILVIDIGGGSTEFIWHDPNKPAGEGIEAVSLPLGSVVLHEVYVHSDPISDDNWLQVQNYIMTELLTLQGGRWGGGSGALQRHVPAKLVAVAGTATTLAAMKLKLYTYSHAEVHGTSISLDELNLQVEQLRAASIEARKRIPGIEAARADVVLEGAMLLHETMQLFGYEAVTISDRGVRWGLIYEQFPHISVNK